MYAVARSYSGPVASRLFDLLEQRKCDVEALMRDVLGLKSYTLLRGGDGGVSVTVCNDQAGAEKKPEGRAGVDPEERFGHRGERARRSRKGTVLLQIG